MRPILLTVILAAVACTQEAVESCTQTYDCGSELTCSAGACVPLPPCEQEYVTVGADTPYRMFAYEAHIDADGAACSRGGQWATSTTWDAAQAACVAAGWRLCTGEELASQCPTGPKSACNLSTAQIDPTGFRSGCVGSAGAYDILGNHNEWSSEGTTFGGGANSGARTECSWRHAVSIAGFRCCQ